MPSCGNLQTRQLKKLTQMNLQYKIALLGKFHIQRFVQKHFFLQGVAPPLRKIPIKLKSLLPNLKEKQRFLLILFCYGFPFMIFKAFFFQSLITNHDQCHQ